MAAYDRSDDEAEAEAALVRKALARLVVQVERAELKPERAILIAYAMGGETERAEAMHRACREWSRARAAREQAFKAIADGDSRP